MVYIMQDDSSTYKTLGYGCGMIAKVHNKYATYGQMDSGIPLVCMLQ